MSWFDDLLNTQWWKDGVALPRRQVVNVTFPQLNVVGGNNDGSIIDNGPGLDSHNLQVPSYRPYYCWFLTAAPAVNSLRFVRPYRDLYDPSGATAVSQALVVPRKFNPSYLSWICFGSALTDAITFTAYKNGAASGLSLAVPGNTSGFNNALFQANSGNITWDKLDQLGLGVTQAASAAQAAWHALVVLQ